MIKYFCQLLITNITRMQPVIAVDIFGMCLQIVVLLREIYQDSLVLRNSGDSLAMSPPLIVERAQIDDMVSILGDAIRRVA